MIHKTKFKGETVELGETELNTGIVLSYVASWSSTTNKQYPTQVNLLTDSIMIKTPLKEFDEIMSKFYQDNLIAKFN